MRTKSTCIDPAQIMFNDDSIRKYEQYRVNNCGSLNFNSGQYTAIQFGEQDFQSAKVKMLCNA